MSEIFMSKDPVVYLLVPNIFGTISFGVFANHADLHLLRRWVWNLKQIWPSPKLYSFLCIYSPVQMVTYCFLNNLFDGKPLDKLKNNFIV